MTEIRENEATRSLPTHRNHLLRDERGKYPAQLNKWEINVPKTECKRRGFKLWYRNPQQSGQSSLGVAYRDNNQYKIV